MIKRVVIVGSRDFENYKFFSSKVNKCLSDIRNGYELIILPRHCSGVDIMAEQYAEDNGFALEIFHAEWSKYGKAAGPKRNKQMIEVADFAIAFPSGGNGTKSLIELAKKREYR